MFEVTATTRFNATHALAAYNGADEEEHPHEWTCEVTVQSGELDSSGCAFDFVELDRSLKTVIDSLACRAIHKIPDFAGISASAENIAKHIFMKLKPAIGGAGRKIARVTVWEDADHRASYFE